MANAWGELTWSLGNYGEQNNATVSLSGVSATPSVGNFNVTVVQEVQISGLQLNTFTGNEEAIPLNTGWGIKAWGVEPWGQSGTVLLSGVSASTTVGNFVSRAGASADATGSSLSTNASQVFVSIDNEALVQGQNLNTFAETPSISGDGNTGFFGSATAQTLNGVVAVNGIIEIGWGGDEWGANLWGDLSGEFVDVGSVSASFDLGSVTVNANANVDVTGIELQTVNAGVVAGTSASIDQEGIGIQIVTGNEEINLGVPVTGINLNTVNEGVTVADQPLIGSGWGRSLWGDFVWGDAYSVQTGSVSAQIAINEVTTQANANVDVQGQSLSITTGNELPEADANVFPNGISLSADVGTVEALRIQGIEMSTSSGTVDIQAGGNVFVNATENGLQTTLSGDTFVFANYVEEVTGISAQINIGNETVQANANVDVTGNSLTTEIGDEFAFTDVTVAIEGQQLSTFIGNETAFTDVTVELTGQSITGAVGDITPESIYSVTGIPLTANIGSVTVQANADVNITGISLTTAIGSPNIVAWAEVDTGTDVTWTEVDLAA